MDEATDSNAVYDEASHSDSATDEPSDSNPAKGEAADSNSAAGEPSDSKPVADEPVAAPRPLMEIQVSIPKPKIGALMDIPINPIWLNQYHPGYASYDDFYESDNYPSFYSRNNKSFRGQSHRNRPYESMNPSWNDEDIDYTSFNESDSYEFSNRYQSFGGGPVGQPNRRRPSADRQMNRTPYSKPSGSQKSSVGIQKTNQSPSDKPVSLMDLPVNPVWKNQSYDDDWSY